MAEFDSLTTGTTGFYRYPAVTQKQVEWAISNVDAIRAAAEIPAVTPEHKKAVGMAIAKFMLMYVPHNEKGRSGDEYKTIVARQQVIAEGLLDDLAPYPLWAINEGLAEYRKSEAGKWPPKVSGELLPAILSAFGRAGRTLINCERLIGADIRGHNLDCLEGSLEGLEGRELAHRALDILNKIEKITDISRDDAAKALHTKCYNIFHDWRRANPLPEFNYDKSLKRADADKTGE